MTGVDPQNAQTNVTPPLERRSRDLATLASETFNVVIVGGGIVGSGALLDATSRGMRAALIEQDDVASGTSSRSSRLIHGGLRYLEHLRFGLVFEALAERSRLLHLAPHLVHLEPFLFPIYGWPVVHRVFYGSGLLLYDLLGSRNEGGFARHLSVEATLEHTPGLRRDGLRGGILYHDGVEDDARYALAVLRTATAAGAVAVTRAKVTGLLESDGSVNGVRARDTITGTELDIRATNVIDATGVWAAEPNGPLATGGSKGRILPSRGAHLVIRRDRIPSRAGLTIRVPGKVVFMVPWPGHWLIGTTDHVYQGPPERPTPSSGEVDELLAAVNRTIEVDLTRADVVGTFAGLRPLVDEGGDILSSTIKASREHRVRVEPNRLVRIGGGKYTTYRVMARDAVDAALGPDEARRRPSNTADLRLVGAADPPDLERLAANLEADLGGDLARDGDLPTTVAARLVARHGTQAPDVVAVGRDLDLLRRLAPDVDHLEAEVVWAARHELAMTLDDVLSRRTRLAQERPDRAASMASRVAEILGAELGWDAGRQAAEVDAYLEGAHREYDVPQASETAPEHVSETVPQPA
jgi:glycerol-3-phosphate dehydrogenase